MKEILVSDVTIKQYAEITGEQLTFKEKLEAARLLDKLSVPVIELGPIVQKKADALLIKSIAAQLKNSALSVTAGLTEESIRMTWDALKEAKKPRLQVQASLSPTRMEYVYHQKADGMKACVIEAVAACKKLTSEVEFVAEDATRSDFSFLAEVLREVVKAGATTITLTDTAGNSLPSEFAERLEKLYAEVPELKSVRIGCAFVNYMNLAEASAVEACMAGAEEVKASMLDLNTVDLTAFSRILSEKTDALNASTSVRITEIRRTKAALERLIHNKRPDNSLLEDGVREYSEDLFYTVNDSLEEIMKAIGILGYELSEDDNIRVYNAFKTIAERKDRVGIKELEVIIASEAMQVPDTYTLKSYVVTTSNTMDIVAHVKMISEDRVLDGLSLGDGPVDAAFRAIEKVVGRHYEVDDFQIQAITEGREAMGQTIVKLRSGGSVYSGRGISTDIIGSAILAYINALNKIVYEEGEE